MQHADPARNGRHATRRTHPFTTATQDWQPGFPGKARSDAGFPGCIPAPPGTAPPGRDLVRTRLLTRNPVTISAPAS